MPQHGDAGGPRDSLLEQPEALGAGRAAQQATRTIPIVVGGMADPVGDGLIAIERRFADWRLWTHLHVLGFIFTRQNLFLHQFLHPSF
jgi:hypothetical protein